MNKVREIPWPRILAEGAASIVSILLAFWTQAWWDEKQERIGERIIKVVLTLLSFACISGCTTTDTAVVTGQERSPIDPAAVTLYFEPPAHYEVMGIVKGRIPFFASDWEVSQPTRRLAFAELKKQAAKIGANGVIDWRFREIEKYDDVYDPDLRRRSEELNIIEIAVTGTAIYVISNSQCE